MASPSSRSTITLFLVSTFIFWLALYVYIPILAPYASHLGGSMTVVGLVVASYGFTQLLFRIPVGVWSDRLGRRKPFLVIGLLVLAASAAGLAVSPTPEWLIIARGLAGVAACSWVIWSVMYAGYLPPERTTAAMSHLATCSALGQMVSTYAGGWIAETYGWLMPFYVSAALGIVNLVCVLFIPEVSVPRSTRLTFHRVASIGLTPTLLTVSLIAALGQYVNFITIYGFSPVYATQIGATKAQLGTLTLVGMLCQTVTALLSGTWCAVRFGERQTVIGGFLITAAGTALIPSAQTVQTLYLVQAISGIGRGLTHPILMGRAVLSVPQDERGTAMGVFQAVYAVGMFVGPAIGGVLGDWIGLPGVFLSTGAVCVAAAVATGISGQWSVVRKISAE